MSDQFFRDSPPGQPEWGKQPPQAQKEQPTLRRGYQSRAYKIKLSLACSLFLAILVVCLLIRAALSGGGSPSRGATQGSSTGQGATPGSVVVLAHKLTPSPPLKPAGLTSPVRQQSPTTSQSPAIYYGVHVALQDMSYVAAFEADAHKAVSIVMWYQHWGVTDGYQYFQAGWMNSVRAHGSIPLVTWDPDDPTQGPNQPTYALQNIINGNFDAYITRWAQDSKAWGHPYFLRFAHEMNGNWNPWSEQVNGNKPGQFILAWRHVHDIFAAQGVTNVTWVWAPNIDYSVSTPLKELYPGDAYVDWVGMDGYNWGTIGGHVWQPFSSLFQQTYQDILSITTKPMMIAETASTEQAGNKASWITDGFVMQLPHNFPLIRAVIWFDQVKETDWRIESSLAAQSAFITAIQSGIYASNSFAALNTSPIPIL